MPSNASTYRIQIVTMAVGRHMIAMARVGGILVKGRMQSDPASAIRELFRELAAPATNQDALMAVELIAAGDDFEHMQQQVDEVLSLSGRGHDQVMLPARRVMTRELPAHDEEDPESQGDDY